MFETYDIVVVNCVNKENGVQVLEKRPCIIISNNIGNQHSPTVNVLPVTSKMKKKYQVTHCILHPNKCNGLTKDSVVLAEQITTVNKNDISKKIGHVYSKVNQERINSCFFAVLTGGGVLTSQ